MLPQFGFMEFLLVASMALIVLGPKELPRLMHRLGCFIQKGRAVLDEFRQAFDDIARQSEIEELRASVEALKRENALSQATRDMKQAEDDINAQIMRQSENSSRAPRTTKTDST